MIILSKFDKNWTKTVACRVFTRFFSDLAYWPSFWADMTHIRTWLRYCLRWSFWASLMKIGPKLWILECSQGFSMIWPTDLVFDPTWLIFKLDPDFIKANILTNFHDDWMHNVACIVFTRFFYHLTYWPSFWPHMTYIRTWPRYCLDDHAEQVWWRLDNNCGL